MHGTKNAVRSIVAGTIVAAALTAGAGSAFAADDYAPATPTPTVTDSVVPVVAPTTGGSDDTTVTPAAVGSSSDELAYTGADVLPWAAAGTVLVLGGTAMVVAGRRKPSRNH